MAPRDKPASGSSMSMAEGTRAGCIHSCRQFRPGHKKKKANSIEKKGQARPGQARSEAGDDFTLSKRSQRLTWIAVGCDTVRTTSKQQLLAHRSTNLCNKGGGAATEAYIQKLADEIIDMAMTRNIDAC
jgi:hypothetical protein